MTDRLYLVVSKLVKQNWAPLLVIGLFSLSLNLIHQTLFPNLSPFDEGPHIDYVHSIQELEFPRRGNVYQQESLRAWACRGGFSADLVFEGCDATNLDPSDFPDGGIQRLKHPPIYYVITAAVSEGVSTIGGVSTVFGARLAGALFSFVGLGSVFLSAVTYLEHRKWLFLSVLLALTASTFTAFHSLSTVNNDAGVFALGGIGVLLAATLKDSKKYWPFVLFAAIAGLTKNTAVVPVAALSVFMMLWRTARAGFDWRRIAFTVVKFGSLPLVTGIVVLLWEQLALFLEVPGFVNPIGRGNTTLVDGLPFDEIASTAFDLAPPSRLNFVPSIYTGQWLRPIHTLIGALIFISVGHSLANKSALIRTSALTLVAGILMAPIMANSVTAVSGGQSSFFATVPTRYAVGLLPLSFLVVAVFAARSLPKPILLGIVAVLFAGSTLVHLTGII